MAWFNDNSVVVNDDDDDDDDDDDEDQRAVQLEAANPQDINSVLETKTDDETRSLVTCPSCGHNIPFQDQHQAAFQDLPGLPAGVKFDPSDQEILEHLEAKVALDKGKLHPLIDEFITTIEGENGICYTHPQKLPGVSTDGQIRHFFHRPSKAYTTGTRKRRKVLTDEDGSETRWHKTGKTRAVVACGTVKGFKKILVLYTNYGRQKKPEKTNWVMHQYHLGGNEEEKDGEVVVSKVFYQTQPRHCGSSIKDSFEPKLKNRREQGHAISKRQSTALVDHFCGPSFISYDHHHGSHSSREGPSNQLIPNLVAHAHRYDASSLIHLSADTSKGKPQRN